jgi:hypothetical protein
VAPVSKSPVQQVSQSLYSILIDLQRPRWKTSSVKKATLLKVLVPMLVKALMTNAPGVDSSSYRLVSSMVLGMLESMCRITWSDACLVFLPLAQRLLSDLSRPLSAYEMFSRLLALADGSPLPLRVDWQAMVTVAFVALTLPPLPQLLLVQLEELEVETSGREEI